MLRGATDEQSLSDASWSKLNVFQNPLFELYISVDVFFELGRSEFLRLKLTIELLKTWAKSIRIPVTAGCVFNS